MERRLLALAEVEERRQDRRVGIGKRGSAHASLRIRAQDRAGRVHVITGVAVRLETVGTAAVFADVRLVGNLPVADAGPALLVVPHQVVDKLLPVLVTGRLHDVLVDPGEQRLRFEGDAHERLRAGVQNLVHSRVERGPVIAAGCGQQVVILLKEQPDHPRAQGAHLGDAAGKHGLVRQATLAQRETVHLHRPEILVQMQGDARVPLLGERRGAKRQREDQYRKARHACLLSLSRATAAKRCRGRCRPGRIFPPARETERFPPRRR